MITVQHVMPLIGHRVIAIHVSGHHYHGVLHSVTDHGIYLSNATILQTISTFSRDLDVNHAISNDDKVDASEVFFPFLFLPLAALAGVAAASAAYGPYGYPPYYY